MEKFYLIQVQFHVNIIFIIIMLVFILKLFLFSVIFSDVFLQIGTDLPMNHSIYGFGERKTSLKLK